MGIYLSQPLFDEPHFSVVGRYMRDTRALAREVMWHVYGYRARAQVLAYNLEHVARVTKECWGLSPNEIAEQLTSYPYYAALLSKENVGNLFERMLSPLTSGNSVAWLLRLERCGRRKLRYCEACFGDDIQDGVPRHWRRAHQLPGVCVCPWHGIMLWEVPNARSIREGYLLPEDIAVVGSSRIQFDISAEQQSACHKLACMSYRLLTNCVYVDPRIFRAQFDAFWRGRSLRGIELIAHRDLAMACEEYFGRDFLLWAGARPATKDVYARVLGSRKSTGLLSPFRIVLLATACDAMQVRCPGPGRYVNPTNRKQPIPTVHCINDLASHGAGHFVERIKERGDHYAASCSCGACFTFSRYSGVSAEDVKRTCFGHETKRVVFELYFAGTSTNEIASTIGMKVASARRLLRCARAESI